MQPGHKQTIVFASLALNSLELYSLITVNLRECQPVGNIKENNYGVTLGTIYHEMRYNRVNTSGTGSFETVYQLFNDLKKF